MAQSCRTACSEAVIHRTIKSLRSHHLPGCKRRWAKCSSETRTIYEHDRYIGEINPLKTAHIDGPSLEWEVALRYFVLCRIAWSTKRQDSTTWTEVILSSSCTPFVHAQGLQGSKHPKRISWNSVNQCAAPSTYRAIAASHVVEIELNLKATRAAVA